MTLKSLPVASGAPEFLKEHYKYSEPDWAAVADRFTPFRCLVKGGDWCVDKLRCSHAARTQMLALRSAGGQLWHLEREGEAESETGGHVFSVMSTAQRPHKPHFVIPKGVYVIRGVTTRCYVKRYSAFEAPKRWKLQDFKLKRVCFPVFDTGTFQEFHKYHTQTRSSQQD